MRGMNKEVISCQVALSQNSYPITGTWLAIGVEAVDKAQLVFSVGNTDAGAEGRKGRSIKSWVMRRKS